MNKGIIVGANLDIEWLLPWWWYNYQAHNSLPVTFFDFGMSEKGRNWCKAKGQVIECITSLTLEKTKVEPSLAKKWETIIGSGVWDVRTHWFKKTFAFAKTPYDKTIWIDLDCEVRSNVDAIFSYLTDDIELALAPEPELIQKGFRSLGFILPTEITYNSGVVAYHKNKPFLKSWENEVIYKSHLHIGDQDALSRVLFENKTRLKELPSTWNWDRGLGVNPDAAIFHWQGQKGKQLIQKQIQAIRELGLEDFLL